LKSETPGALRKGSRMNRVLIVEDQAALVALVVQALARAGIAADAAAGTAQATACLQSVR
jgi:DNA-binding NtrC family response regulator